MKNKQIAFTKPNNAELVSVPLEKPKKGEVLVETLFSAISAGTEKANIMGNLSVSPGGGQSPWPRVLGYSSCGIISEVGEDVTDLKIGDRVIVFWSQHKKYKIIPAKNVVKIEDDIVSSEEAALMFISTFPLAAIRKTRLEIGESALVMGLGILGQFAVKYLKAAGEAPIIAADPVESRRMDALSFGADYAFDPLDKDFAEKVRSVSGGGVNVCIEVTGVGEGLNGALDCMARFGRVALLGCTRDKNFLVDYYHKVHSPGISLIGAHTMARPEEESHPGCFTHRDDIRTALKLCALGRVNFKDIIKEINSPADCTKVYERLVNDKNFPIGVIFDWRDIKCEK